MDNQAVFFCQLIKQVLHSNKKHNLEKEVDWEYLIYLAKEHNILPFFLESAVNYCSYNERTNSRQELQEAFSIVSAQVKRTSAFLKLYQAFSDAGIYPIVMKGLVCRELYGKLCDHRPSGDEDILINPSEYLRAREVLIANGYISEKEYETETQLKKIQEVSFFHPTERLHIELHLNVMGRDNDMRCQMSDCFIDVFHRYREFVINEVTLRTLSHQDHILLLVLHAFKHFTCGGFGIRQAIDILLYLEQYGREIDNYELNRMLKRFRADVFLSDIICVGNMYLGFELESRFAANCPNDLLKDMILGGVFGNSTTAERAAGRTIQFAIENCLQRERVNVLTILFKTLFPRRVYLLSKAPYLQDKPWLLPLAWLQRWSRFLKRTRNAADNVVVESVQISQRRMKLLKKYDLM